MYTIGIDLGGTNIAVGLVDENYNIVKKISTPTLAARGAEEITKDMAALSKRVCEECGAPCANAGSYIHPRPRQTLSAELWCNHEWSATPYRCCT